MKLLSFVLSSLAVVHKSVNGLNSTLCIIPALELLQHSNPPFIWRSGLGG